LRFPFVPAAAPLVTLPLTGATATAMKKGMRGRIGTIAPLAALFTAIGLLFFSYHYLDDLARGMAGTALPRFIEEMTGAYTAAIVIPIVVWITRWVPVGPRTWPLALAAQLGGLCIYTALHTSLMAISRAILFPLAGLGPYDYGIMWYRYPMEASFDTLIYAMVVGFVYVFERLRQARESEVRAAELQTQLARSQLENLKLQLHPHFLFNTLNAISSVMYEDVGKADTMMAKLSDFLRLVLDSSGVHEVPLERELVVEQMYVDIMKTRLDSRLNLSLDIPPELRDAAVPFMLLQPLLENSIKHGLRADSNTLDIEITAHREDGATVIAICDNGRGVRADGAAERHGLANVRERLAHMYGDEASFSIAPARDLGTQVTLHIPFSSLRTGAV
jgi:two-component system, LytTR family, sensor kinase